MNRTPVLANTAAPEAVASAKNPHEYVCEATLPARAATTMAPRSGEASGSVPRTRRRVRADNSIAANIAFGRGKCCNPSVTC